MAHEEVIDQVTYKEIYTCLKYSRLLYSYDIFSQTFQCWIADAVMKYTYFETKAIMLVSKWYTVELQWLKHCDSFTTAVSNSFLSPLAQEPKDAGLG